MPLLLSQATFVIVLSLETWTWTCPPLVRFTSRREVNCTRGGNEVHPPPSTHPPGEARKVPLLLMLHQVEALARVVLQVPSLSLKKSTGGEVVFQFRKRKKDPP